MYDIGTRVVVDKGRRTERRGKVCGAGYMVREPHGLITSTRIEPYVLVDLDHGFDAKDGNGYVSVLVSHADYVTLEED